LARVHHRLQLLNSTVSQLAKAVNQVLTAVYTALYGEDSDTEPQRLSLRTAPLAAAEEVERLYTAGVLDCKFAIPATLHALGVSPEEIDKAVEEACEKREKEQQLMEEDRKKAEEEQKLSQEERKVGMQATKAQIEVTKKEAAGMVRAPAASSGSGSE
jgi:DNA-binding transcriptional MerR regulator